MERVRDHRRVHHFVHRHDLAQHGVLIVLGVVRRGHLDPCELLAGGPEFVHVPARSHAVHVHHGRPVDVLERHVRRGVPVISGRRAGRHALRARPSGERDQRDLAFTRRDRLGSVTDMQDIGRAADLGSVHMPDVLQAHIFDHRQRAEAGRVAGAVIRIDIPDRQAGVVERALRAFGMELGDRLVDRLAGGVLADTRNKGFAPCVHSRFHC